MVQSITAFMAVVSLISQTATVAATPSDYQADPRPAVVLDDVEVSARRGAALVAAEREYDAGAIDALAAYDISDVIGRIAERLGDREPPVLIINGRKVADPSIFTRFPPDAMIRLEVLPAEAAALYGEAPGRRVLNLVLERQFKTTTGQVGAGAPTDPGALRLHAGLQYAALADQSALSSGIDLNSSSALRVREREGYALRAPGDDLATLLPGTRLVAVNVGGTRPIGDWSSSFRANLRQAQTSSTTLLNDVAAEYGSRTEALGAALGLSGDLAGWTTQLAFDLDLSASRQVGLSSDRQTLRSIKGTWSASRALLNMPAGDLLTNLSATVAKAESTSEGRVSGSSSRAHLSAQSVRLSGGMTVPLARRHDAEGARQTGMGDAVLTLGGAVVAGDAGNGHGLNAELAWTPLDHLRLQATLATDQQPPTVQQLYAPVVYGEPTTVFDLTRGEAVQIIPIRGGNPALWNSGSTVMTAGLSAGPYTTRSLQLGLTYSHATSEDGIGVLATPTGSLEALYPDRFLRNADGRLVSIDQRPLNLASSLNETIHLNIGAGLPLSTSADGETQLISLNLNTAYRLKDQTDLGNGASLIDTLAGVGGGQPRQEMTLFLDTSRGRWSGSLSTRWQSAYRLRLAESPDPGDVLVDDLATVNLRGAFTLAGRRAGGGAPDSRRAGGGQIVLEIENLFDARPSARLADGQAAPGYGRDDRDPLGRAIRVQLSRRF